jgi:hypothetical protein
MVASMKGTRDESKFTLPSAGEPRYSYFCKPRVSVQVSGRLEKTYQKNRRFVAEIVVVGSGSVKAERPEVASDARFGL